MALWACAPLCCAPRERPQWSPRRHRRSSLLCRHCPVATVLSPHLPVAGPRSARPVPVVLPTLFPARPTRSLRAFAFVDLCGFTDFVEVRPVDAALVAELVTMRSVCHLVVSTHGIRSASWLGAGCMLVGLDTTQPTSTVVDAEMASSAPARTARRVAGIGAGPVVFFDGHDYAGRLLNLASRLCNLAGSNEVLLTADLAVSIPDTAPHRSLGACVLRGFPRPSRGGVVTSTRQSAPSSSRPSKLHSPATRFAPTL